MAFYTFLCGALLMTGEPTTTISLNEALEALTANHPIFAKTSLEIEQAQLNESALKQEEVWHLKLQEENLVQGGDPANPFGPTQQLAHRLNLDFNVTFGQMVVVSKWDLRRPIFIYSTMMMRGRLHLVPLIYPTSQFH